MELVLDFERPIVELYRRIDSLRSLEESDGVDLSASIVQLEEQASRLHDQIFSALTPWQRTLLSRHPARPYTLDYVEHIFEDFEELRGTGWASRTRPLSVGSLGFRECRWP